MEPKPELNSQPQVSSTDWLDGRGKGLSVRQTIPLTWKNRWVLLRAALSLSGKVELHDPCVRDVRVNGKAI